MQPWVHYVPCARWFEDLPDVIRRLQSDDSLARRIADSGRQFGQQFVSLDAAKDYTAALFGQYARLLADAVTDADVPSVDCKAVKDGPMGCDKGWRQWDGVPLWYPDEVMQKWAKARLKQQERRLNSSSMSV